jgi:hypothetical protein
MNLKRNILGLFIVVIFFGIANYIGYSSFSTILYQEVPERDALNGTQNALANLNHNKAGILQHASHRVQHSFTNGHQAKNHKKYFATKQFFVSDYVVEPFQGIYFTVEIGETCKSPIYITCRKLII